jgi:ribose 5-phosphate isomerase B
MKIILAADHAGFALKERVKVHLLKQGTAEVPKYFVTDYGPHVYDPQDDYPDTIKLAMSELQDDVDAGGNSRGIIFGGSGQGEAMCANRFAGIRATVYYAPADDIIALSREHNNANVLSIGARFVNADDALVIIDRWLATPFSEDERHVRRIKKMDIAP